MREHFLIPWLACLETQLDAFLLLLGRRVSKVIHRAVTLMLLGVVLLLLQSLLYIEKQDSSVVADDVQQLCLLVLQINTTV